MGGAGLRSRRAAALAAAVLVHACLLALFVVGLGDGGREASPAAPVTTVVFAVEPAAQLPQEARSAGPAFRAPAIPSTAITVPPLTPTGDGGAVDWQAAAHDAATPKGAPAPRPLGENPATAARAGAPEPSAAHVAGEQYRAADGTWVVWVSDRCFIASDPAPLGQPDILTRAGTTRAVCKGDPGWSRADLFKDLPAYQKYHPSGAGVP